MAKRKARPGAVFPGEKWRDKEKGEAEGACPVQSPARGRGGTAEASHLGRGVTAIILGRTAREAAVCPCRNSLL